MYNISSHYQNIFEYCKKFTKHRRLLYLFPYGSTKIENIETITDNIAHMGGVLRETPMLIFYDQEPIYPEYNYNLFDYIKQRYQPPFILITTEQDSGAVRQVQNRYNWLTMDYFHHIFAASDWYRGYKFNTSIVDPSIRKIQKKFITFNRITGNSRVYRTLFVVELLKKNLLQYGHVSYSKICPVHGDAVNNIQEAVNHNLINIDYATHILKLIDQIDKDLRIDNQETTYIKNDSMSLGPIDAIMESFVYVVTETCFWETKKHLTEKIFKPIVAKQPFLLMGCANNLEYLKSYGFKTFAKWWDEGYDKIQDPVARLKAVVDIVENICKMSNNKLEYMLKEMEPVLLHNYNLFFSEKFICDAWTDFQSKLDHVIAQQQSQIVLKN